MNSIAHIVHFLFYMSIHFSGRQFRSSSSIAGMQTISLYDVRGRRKYLTPKERRQFAMTALRYAPSIQTFCLTLIFTGARISEALSLTMDRFDRTNELVVLETLKRRKHGIFRGVPVPNEFLLQIELWAKGPTAINPERGTDVRLWAWSRTTAWKYVKAVMLAAGISPTLATPRAIRHAFAIDAIQSGAPLNLVQRWMGHARIETTSIYANATGPEERAVAERMWIGLIP